MTESGPQPTGHTAEQRLPKEAVEAMGIVRDVLGSTVVGAYLFGSAVVDGLKPGSDVDMLVVVKKRLSENARRSLVARLMRVSGNPTDDGSARPIELTVLYLSDVVPWRYPTRHELVYGEWLREDFEENRIPRPGPDPDLAIVLAQVRENSITLIGPDALELLDPVPMEDLQRAIAESLPDLIRTPKGDERNVILTLARMWVTVSTGEIVPKDDAAARAFERLPQEHGVLVDMARRAYLGEVKDHWGGREKEVTALVNYMKESIETCLRSTAEG